MHNADQSRFLENTSRKISYAEKNNEEMKSWRSHSLCEAYLHLDDLIFYVPIRSFVKRILHQPIQDLPHGQQIVLRTIWVH